MFPPILAQMGSLIHSVHRPVKIFLPAILILVLLQYWIWQPPHWVHHLGPMLSQIHHHSHHSDHTHGQTTQSGESHQQQVDEECLALGCAGSRKFVAFQNSLLFFQSFAFENPGLPYPDEVPFIQHAIFFPSIPTRGPPRNNCV